MLTGVRGVRMLWCTGPDIMEADNRRVTSLHSPTVIPPSVLDEPSIMKRHRRRRTCSHISPRRSPTMVTLYDTRFVGCRWWNNGWTVKTVVTWRSSASVIPAPGSQRAPSTHSAAVTCFAWPPPCCKRWYSCWRALHHSYCRLSPYKLHRLPCKLPEKEIMLFFVL